MPAPRQVMQTVSVPARGRAIQRRAATDSAAGLTAFVVRDQGGGALSGVSVALKRGDRLSGALLRGHRSDIVDMEFLPTPPGAKIFTLGSCDVDGVVFLWFLTVLKDALGIEVGLRQLKKFSFYSLRKTRTAFYSRIRLAGTAEKGTMVLVPNDGSNVRIIAFHCEQAEDGSGPVPVIAPPPGVMRIEGPPPTAEEGGAKADVPGYGDDTLDEPAYDAGRGIATGMGAAGVGAGAAVVAGVGAGAAVAAGVGADGYESSSSSYEDANEEQRGSADEDEFNDEDGVEYREEQQYTRDPRNSTFPLSRIENEELEVDPDIAEATALAAGIPPAAPSSGSLTEDERSEDEGDYGSDVVEGEGSLDEDDPEVYDPDQDEIYLGDPDQDEIYLDSRA